MSHRVPPKTDDASYTQRPHPARCWRHEKRLALVLSLILMTTLSALGQSSYRWQSFVGSGGGPGDLDGSGTAARFSYPSGVAVAGNGDFYVADLVNSTIRKVSAGGVATTFAGMPGVYGSDDGVGSAARFNGPCGIAIDAGGNLYVTESSNCTIRKITAAGVVTTLAGSAGVIGSVDGTGNAALFNSPSSVAVDNNGNVYVTDCGNSTIRKITAAGVVTTIAGTPEVYGSDDGTGAAAQFAGPNGIAVDGGGNLYVADSGNSTIRMITPGGVATTLAGAPGNGPFGGSADGTGNAAGFSYPCGIALDGNGNLYVADKFNHTIRMVTAQGVVTTPAGKPMYAPGDTDGTGTTARFDQPQAVAVNPAGNIYVADFNNHTIRLMTPGGDVATFVGAAPSSGSNDGTGSAARFYRPTSTALDSHDNLYVADTFNNVIRKVSAAGVVSTFAGSPGAAGHSDGVGAAARFNGPEGVATDGSDNVYVADFNNHTIRKISPNGTVSTLAGAWGAQGSTDGAAASARFNFPAAVAVDANNNVYVADYSNHTIRKITAAGQVSTLAGSAGNHGSDDGIGSAASFFAPTGVAVDANGNVYVAEYQNHTIRKITANGTVTTLAGSADSPGSTDGIGGQALFYSPIGVALDAAGNLYVSEQSNATIRKITPAAVVTTIGGTTFHSGNQPGLGKSAYFYAPAGLSVRGDGVIFVANSVCNDITIGTPIPDIVIEQPAGTALHSGSSTIDWGNTEIGASTVLTFTVRNTGAAPLNLSAPDITGAQAAEFAVSSALGATTLAPEATTTFSITFTPGALGVRNAALHLASDALTRNPFNLNLSGTGADTTAPVITDRCIET